MLKQWPNFVWDSHRTAGKLHTPAIAELSYPVHKPFWSLSDSESISGGWGSISYMFLYADSYITSILGCNNIAASVEFIHSMSDDDAPPIESTCAPGSSRKWSAKDVTQLVSRLFNKCPCWLQVQAALALYGGKDVIVCATTGFGKTLTFWIPLLMALEEGQDKLTIVVTPLNLLGKQNVDNLKEVGITAVAVDAESLNEDLSKVNLPNL